MLNHIHDVQIDIMSDVFGHVHTDQLCVSQHSFVLNPEEVEHTRFDVHAPATILPKHAHFVCLVLDKQGNTFISSDRLYTAKMQYSLRNIVPNDSVFHAVIFEVRNGSRPVLGLFDASRLGGLCLLRHQCIDRHSMLHKAFKPTTAYPHIRMHWVGHERVLVHQMKFNSVVTDFDVQCALRLCNELSCCMTYSKIMPVQPITYVVPRLNNAKMLETLRTKRAKKEKSETNL
jgi:hypothetical protein